MTLANAGHSVDLKIRWSHSEKRMVPFVSSVAKLIRTALLMQVGMQEVD